MRAGEMSGKSRLLILGASGMLGNACVRWFSQSSDYSAFGTVRSGNSLRRIAELAPSATILSGIDVENSDCLMRCIESVRPDVILNCVGVVKQLNEADEPLTAIPINALLPHRLAHLAKLSGARLIHFSTDCVFSGLKGGYKEEDSPDAKDLYGRTKLLGEVDYPNAITIRTSIIGHEMAGAHSLIGWFLAQEGRIRGFTKAIFSGLPTVEMARIVHDHVLPHPEMHGVYHVSAEPISKYDLLMLVAKEYSKEILIEPDADFSIDRSLNSERFRAATGFQPSDWETLVANMHKFS